MKITATQYANSLYELTAEKTKHEIDGVVESFLKVLVKKRQLKLAKKIIAKFSEISNREKGVVEATVISARDNNQETRNKIEKYIKEKYQAKKVVLNSKIDESIKGGIIIKVGDEILDGSVVRQLENLKSSISK